MKKLMYIFLALPILTGCKEKKSTGAMGGMPTPEISVAKPVVKDITLTKDYPGYLTTEQTVNLVARVNGTLQDSYFLSSSLHYIRIRWNRRKRICKQLRRSWSTHAVITAV